MGRVILDTGVLVAVDRGRAQLAKQLRARDDDITIAAVTAAEQLQGVGLASDELTPAAVRVSLTRCWPWFRWMTTRWMWRVCMPGCWRMPEGPASHAVRTT